MGDTRTAPWVQGAWVIAGLAMAFGAMVVAILWPAGIGVALGGPAIVFFGLGFIIPFTIACQLGTSLRIPSQARSSCGRFFSACSSRQSPGRAAGSDRRDRRLDGSSNFGERLQALGQRPTGWPERQDNDGSRRRTGRRVTRRLLDRGGAGAASDRRCKANRNGRQAGRFRRPCFRHQFGVGRQRGLSRLCTQHEDCPPARPDSADRFPCAGPHQRSSGFRRPRRARPGAHWHALFRPALPVSAVTVASRSGGDARARLGGGVGRPRRPHRRGAQDSRNDRRVLPRARAQGRRALAAAPHRAGRKRERRAAHADERREVHLRRGRRRRPPRRDRPRCRSLDRHPQWRALSLGQSGRHVHPSPLHRQRGRFQSTTTFSTSAISTMPGPRPFAK